MPHLDLAHFGVFIVTQLSVGRGLDHWGETKPTATFLFKYNAATRWTYCHMAIRWAMLGGTQGGTWLAVMLLLQRCNLCWDMSHYIVYTLGGTFSPSDHRLGATFPTFSQLGPLGETLISNRIFQSWSSPTQMFQNNLIAVNAENSIVSSSETHQCPTYVYSMSSKKSS